MDAVSCIGGNSVSASAFLAQTAETLRAGGLGGGEFVQSGTRATSAAGLGSFVSSIEQSFTQSLQSSGGTAATEQLLRTMMAVMILLALLEQTQRSSDSSANAQSLASLASAGSFLQESLSTSSFFYSEQSTMSLSMSGSSSYAEFSVTAMQFTGGELDISI